MSEVTQRRLTAIVSADVVGYTRLMQADEAGTHKRLKSRYQDLVAPKIEEFGGRVVKLMGDGLLAEFPSVVSAADWAVDMQNAVAAANESERQEHRITYRIGVNLGDVIVDGDDIYGDGVNIAARLQEIADTGGVCLSDDAHRQVRGKIATEFVNGGEATVKNVIEPVRVWRWSPDQAAPGSEPDEAVAPSLEEVVTQSDKPAIAVLPFDNMSGDSEQAYFADGIAEDITTELSRFGSLFVVSRHSAFKYRGAGLDLAHVGAELGVQYLLEGSVRRGGDRVRITVQLIDTATGNHVWAERYDRKLEDIFAIQDEITETVASTVAGRVQAIGIDRAKRKRTENLAAYDYLLKGLDLHKGGIVETETVERAVAMFDMAIELDRGFARAHAWRACSGSRLWGDDVSDRQLDESLEIVKTALALDEGESETHRIMGAIYMWKRDFERAEMHMRRAIALNPNDAHVAVKAGMYFSFAGQPEEALASIRRAMRLNPHHPDWYWTELGLAFHTAGDFPAAIEALVHNTAPTFFDLALLAASCAEVGRVGEAATYAKQLSEAKPNATVAYFEARLPYRRPDDRARLIAGLRKAGVAEA
jgi:adenylate cyclase